MTDTKGQSAGLGGGLGGRDPAHRDQLLAFPGILTGCWTGSRVAGTPRGSSIWDASVARW